MTNQELNDLVSRLKADVNSIPRRWPPPSNPNNDYLLSISAIEELIKIRTETQSQLNELSDEPTSNQENSK
jgi:hypothetical protein